MDNLVSVPVTNPCTFLKGQSVDPPVTRPALLSAIKSPDADPPVKPKRPVKPSVARKLAQEWLEF